MANQQYCLRWNNHQNNLLKVFSRLLGTEQLTDVVVAAEGCTIRAHKVVLSACSAYFEHLFSVFNEANQIVVLKDTSFADATAIVEFMYRGEINVSQGQLASLLRSAENLKVKGLAEVSGTPPSQNSNNGDFSALPMMPPPMSRPGSNANTLKRHIHGPDLSGGEVKRKRGRPRTLDSPNEPPDPCFVPSRYHQVSSSSSSKRETVPASESNSPVENGSFGHMPTPGGPLTSERLGELGIVKMNDYLSNGTRQQFWEEHFVKVILHAVCNKEIDMKTSAELLGVSYGTLYGRYRETFGYLKGGNNGAQHLSPAPPGFRMPKFDDIPGPEVVLNNANEDVDEETIFKELKDGHIDMKRAAVLLGVDETMLAYQMALKYPDEEESPLEGDEERPLSEEEVEQSVTKKDPSKAISDLVMRGSDTELEQHGNGGALASKDEDENGN